MEKKLQEQTEVEKVELMIGKILRIGVTISTVIIFFGIFLSIFDHGTGYGEFTFPRTVSGIAQGLMLWKPGAWMMFGLFCLILTPVLRVVVSVWAFYVERDYLYVTITLIVLVILIIGLFLGVG